MSNFFRRDDAGDRDALTAVVDFIASRAGMITFGVVAVVGLSALVVSIVEGL